jgi:hypothetical protein
MLTCRFNLFYQKYFCQSILVSRVKVNYNGLFLLNIFCPFTPKLNFLILFRVIACTMYNILL